MNSARNTDHQQGLEGHTAACKQGQAADWEEADAVSSSQFHMKCGNSQANSSQLTASPRTHQRKPIKSATEDQNSILIT